ncbi:MAG: glycosyltransferase [Oscillospiraceae bacterium]|nr:glycosyltransferase [Oscillospiraceae bacterium]
MILSIGMIVKNEEKYLEKCLTALKPILENVDSELIIADTGSTDSTVEIAKRFTDNVFHFEWINDFAAARNSTLDKAKGEWYMFLDADEIIADCTELINFFNSGEYKDYGSATIVVKNYNDLSNMDIFNSYNLHRLTALADGVRFTKAIHENFSHYFTPIKNLNTVADHYGYVYKDGDKLLDVAEKKTARNLELLFRELEEGEKNGTLKETTFGQIADCYLWRAEYDTALEYIEKGMKFCQPESLINIEYYNKMVKTLNKMGKHEEIIKVCREYFSKENLARKEKLVTDSTIYFFWASSCYVLKDYDEVINKTVLGLDIYRSYRSGKLYTPELNFCGVETTIPMLKQISNMFLIACDSRNRFNDAAAQLKNFPLEDFMPDMKFMKEHLIVRNILMEKTNYNKLPDLYYQLDKPNRELYIDLLIRNVFRTKRHEHFLKKLSLIAGEDERLVDYLKIFNNCFITHDPTTAQLTGFIKKYGTKHNETIWILMMMNNIDTVTFISAKDFEPEESINRMFEDIVQTPTKFDVFTDSVNKLSPEGIETAADVFGAALRNASKNKADITNMVRSFGQIGKRWIELNPNKDRPDNISFAEKINEIAELHRRKNYSECIKRLEELLGDDIGQAPDSDPAISDENGNAAVLRHYLNIVREDEKKNSEMLEKHNANPMMVELADKIKQEIRSMIEEWDLDGAEDALNKMASMAPFDPDIETIRDEITDRKINYMNYM